ncbi:MAG TPA: septal ring lytic transglycosylase RlpA family protein [Candidatus Binataceae bacterium]|nr:septal ring lytic transglycosylase RlpA family protein [Candidatus Binataceae bacterium]
MGGDGYRCLSRLFAALGVASVITGCALFAPRVAPPPSPPAPPAPPRSSSIVGVASWYGPGFNGKHTSSGEIYDQEDLTAASTTLPLGTRALVTNLQNGRSVEVRINDRGPFAKGRKIDLSRAAASALGILNPGTARVRIDVVRQGPESAPGFFVQVGSFSNSSNAQRLGGRLSQYFADVRVDHFKAGHRSYYRVRMGAFPDHATALARATQTSRLGLRSIIEQQ